MGRPLLEGCFLCHFALLHLETVRPIRSNILPKLRQDKTLYKQFTKYMFVLGSCTYMTLYICDLYIRLCTSRDRVTANNTHLCGVCEILNFLILICFNEIQNTLPLYLLVRAQMQSVMCCCKPVIHGFGCQYCL